MKYLTTSLALSMALAGATALASDATTLDKAAAADKLSCELAQSLSKEIYSYAYNVIQPQPHAHLETIDTSLAAIRALAKAATPCPVADNYVSSLSDIRLAADQQLLSSPSWFPPARHSWGGKYEGAYKTPIEDLKLLYQPDRNAVPAQIQQTIRLQ